jgi:anti-sigma B factor antagonist
MALQVQERYCASVYIVKCHGRIVAGEMDSLQEALDRGLRESKRLTVNLSGVSRVDSTGMGLLVRYAVRARSGRGDLHLAEPTPFVNDLLQMTKLSNVIRVHASEDEAILGCLHEHYKEAPTDGPIKGRVLFIDNSPDLCAFVRMLLKEHRYEVISTSLVHDARVIMQASKIDFLIFGPDSPQPARDSLTDSLKRQTPHAAAFQLDHDFRQRDPQQAEARLLEMMGASPVA